MQLRMSRGTTNNELILKNNNPNKHEILAEFAEVMEQYLK